MNELQISLVIIISVVAGVLAVLLGVLPYLKKKGINAGTVIKEVENKGEIAEKVADIIKPLLPKNITSTIDLIEKWGPISAGYAEQIAHAGDIDKSDRAVVAENVVLNVLKQYNIVPTDDEKALIDVTIKNAVNALGHDNTSNIKEAGVTFTPDIKAEPSVGVENVGLSYATGKIQSATTEEASLSGAKPEEINDMTVNNASEASVENKVQVDTSTPSLSPEDAQKIQDAMQTVQSIAAKANIQVYK